MNSGYRAGFAADLGKESVRHQSRARLPDAKFDKTAANPISQHQW